MPRAKESERRAIGRERRGVDAEARSLRAARVDARIRRHVLAEHRKIRTMVGRLRAFAPPLRRGQATALASVRVIVRELEALIRDHIAMEERDLAPLLSRMGPWGPMREWRLFCDHN
jgi:hypothetical protein